MNVKYFRTIIMPLQNKDYPGANNRNKYLLVQWNTWKHRQYCTVDDDDDNGNDMVMSCNDENKFGAVDGVSALLLLNSSDQVPSLASEMPLSL